MASDTATAKYIDYLDKLDGRSYDIKADSMRAVRRSLDKREGLITLRMVLTHDWQTPTISTGNRETVSVHDLDYEQILEYFWRRWRTRSDRSYFDRLRITEGYQLSRDNRPHNPDYFYLIICHDREPDFRKLMRSRVSQWRTEWRTYYTLLDIPRDEVIKNFTHLLNIRNEVRTVHHLASILIFDVGNLACVNSQIRYKFDRNT